MRLIALTLLALGLAAGEAAERDEWFVGTLNGQTMMNLHAVVRRDADGRTLAILDTQLVLSRVILGQTATLSMGNVIRYWLDDAGKVVRFQVDEDANGSRTTAKGAIVDGKAEATVFRLGRSRAVKLDLPADRPMLGWHLENRAVVATCREVGDSYKSCGVMLQNGELVISRPTYTLKEKLADGRLRFEQVDELMPSITTEVVMDAAGTPLRTSLSLGGMAIVVVPAEQPAVLAAGARIDMMQLFKAEGRPRADGANTYQLEERALEAAATGDFQQVADGKLVVVNECAATELADPAPYLKVTAHLEIDEPELVGWVEELLADVDDAPRLRAEALCGAVRSHITTKDLKNADATALETFRSRTGDCTEHATLLCAALRIDGIPARVECGVVYAPALGGWVGHAWTSAWLEKEKRWLHLDAAYPGINRSCYIACRSDPDATGGVAMSMADAISRLMGTTIKVVAE